MREHLDCAVLATPFNETQAQALQGSHAGGRLAIHLLARGEGVETARALAEAAMPLRRYDVCLLHVCPDNLSSVRASLLAAKSVMATPIIAITRGLKAPALNDLHGLGVEDFLREPFCAEELRARCERLLRPPAMPRAGTAKAGTQRGAGTIALAVNEARQRYGVGAAQAEAAANSVLALESHAMAACAGGQGATSLRAAKTQIVERFETAYIRAALHRHRGNIAMAARSVQKHRRAFWALMHKYEIDPQPYRPAARNRPETRRRAMRA